MGKKRASSRSSSSSNSEGEQPKTRPKFETMDASELEDVVIPNPAPYTAYPPCDPVETLNPVFMPTVVPPTPPPPAEPAAVAAASSSADSIPIAALVATDAKPADEVVDGLLREPNPPAEIINISKPGVPVPNLPVELLDLLAK